jgi:hypothetical protein
MKYRVHRVKVRNSTLQQDVEHFINTLEGEISSIVPHIAPFFLFYGGTIDYVLVVEKTA